VRASWKKKRISSLQHTYRARGAKEVRGGNELALSEGARGPPLRVVDEDRAVHAVQDEEAPLRPHRNGINRFRQAGQAEGLQALQAGRGPRRRKGNPEESDEDKQGSNEGRSGDSLHGRSREKGVPGEVQSFRPALRMAVQALTETR